MFVYRHDFNRRSQGSVELERLEGGGKVGGRGGKVVSPVDRVSGTWSGH